jgi:hypothetical protein
MQAHQQPADAVPQDDHAAVEPALLKQFQVQPHAVRKEPLSAADDRWANDHLELVAKPSPYSLSGELRAVNGDVALGVGFEPPDASGSNSRSMRVRALPCPARVLE